MWAVYLCYAVRTVPSAFHEPRYMAIAVHNELVLSAIFHVIRRSLIRSPSPINNGLTEAHGVSEPPH
ncbi:hypothetical protein F2P81_025985 [Scophthalmus maximus]|uniref:Uncharacterized protein n=1 Tax=Scophthalmus maximus TaxID=52904 RepID=A0A6A4RRV7_SCOMX|nr:hypothetical protein F2P81_025985 [Scophthalmus maximus]